MEGNKWKYYSIAIWAAATAATLVYGYLHEEKEEEVKEEKLEMTEEMKDACNKLAERASQCFVMNPEDSLEVLQESLFSPSETVVAFDWDQTVKIMVGEGAAVKVAKVRGGEKSKLFIDKLRDEKFPIVLITAANPTESAAEAVIKEVQKVS